MRATARCRDLPDAAEVSVLLSDDAAIRDLNRTYRHLDKATDVLSFPQDDPLLPGDIVISVETASRQALSADWPLESELALLAVHGLLHLCGHDDVTEAGALDMERITRHVLESASVPLPPGNHPFLTND